MKNKELFLKLVSDRSEHTSVENAEAIQNRAAIRVAQDLALKILDKLEELNWSQKRLAEELGVSEQYVSRIAKGKEHNLGLAVLTKIEQTLDIPIFAYYYEKRVDSINELIFTLEERVETIEIETNQIEPNYIALKSTKVKQPPFSVTYYNQTGS